jgi:hypothetical protein
MSWTHFLFFFLKLKVDDIIKQFLRFCSITCSNAYDDDDDNNSNNNNTVDPRLSVTMGRAISDRQILG